MGFYSPVLASLLAEANVGDSIAAAERAKEMLQNGEWTADERMELWHIRTKAEVRSGRWEAADQSANLMFAEAAQLGLAGRQVQALANLADAHIRNQQTAAGVEALLRAELIVSNAALDVPLARSRYVLANPYHELGFVDLSLEHCQGAVDDLRSLDAPPEILCTALLNLGLQQLDCAINLDRVSWSSAELRGRQSDLSAKALAAFAEHAGHDPADQAGLHELRSRATVLARAVLDPDRWVDDLEELVAGGPEDMDVEELAWTLAALSQVQRRAARPERALATARRAAALTDDPAVYASTIRLGLFELHQAQLAAGIEGSAAIDGYVRSVERAAWESKKQAMDGYLARRALLIAEDERARYRRLANEDPLTGAGNRRALEAWLGEHRTGPAFAAMVDLDDFKTINDHFGHAIGDLALRLLASAIRSAVRAEDLIVRYGGDEFLVVGAGGSDVSDGLGDRLMLAVSGLSMADVVPGLGLRASIGTASVAWGESTATLIKEADQRMFATKRTR